MLSARAAVRSLDLQYYIWHSDATGIYLAHEALLAADRGVRVRLLIDDMDARSRDGILMALDLHPQIEIRLFNPFATRSGMLRTLMEVFSRGSRLNHRMHNKAWIADGRPATDDPGARRLLSILTRYDDPASGRAFSTVLLRACPEAVFEAVLILIARGDAVRRTLLHPGYRDPSTVGGYLDRELPDHASSQ